MGERSKVNGQVVEICRRKHLCMFRGMMYNGHRNQHGMLILPKARLAGEARKQMTCGSHLTAASPIKMFTAESCSCGGSHCWRENVKPILPSANDKSKIHSGTSAGDMHCLPSEWLFTEDTCAPELVTS